MYNGKELQQETEWYDYGARMYDAAVGRFFTQDRFAEKYLNFSPYQYAANNPVLFIDVNGDSLQLTGTGTQKVLDVANNASGGYYTATIDGNGLITYGATGKQGTPSAEQQAFIDNFNAVASHDVGNVSIEVVESDQEVPVGDFHNSKLDIDDIQQFGNGPLLTEQGALMHEVSEQAGKQLYGMEFGAPVDNELVPNAHDVANNTENAVNGTTKGVPRQRVIQDPNNPKIITGNITIPVSTSGGATRNATIIFNNGNVTRVYQR